MTTPADKLEFAKNISTTCYATCVPNLAIWTAVLVRILVQEDKAKFLPLIAICVLMIVSLIASMAYWQLRYTIRDRH